MRTRNEGIRLQIRKSGFYMADIAQELGITASGLYARLQKPLNQEQEQEILSAIDRCEKMEKW